MRIFVVDHQPAVREGLKCILQHHRVSSAFGEASNASEALQRVPGGMWDLVLLDLDLPGECGLRCLEQLRTHCADLRILVFSMFRSAGVAEALDAGANGFVTKTASAHELVEAVRNVSAGGTNVASALGTAVHEHFGPGIFGRVSPREADVLRLVITGAENAAVAKRLGLSLSTVKSVVRSLLNKFAVDDRNCLIVQAMQVGFT